MIEKKRILAILSMLVTAGVLFVGLWPFDLAPKNKAYWLPDQGGLYFDGSRGRLKLSVGGIAYTPSPLISLTPAPSERGAFTAEILLKPARDSTDGVPHILSFVDRSGKDVLYLGQWKQSLIVRWFSHEQNGKRRMREVGVRDALEKGKTQRLTIASNQERTSIYLDGTPAKHFQGTALIDRKESLRGYAVTLGNSRNMKSSWTGNIMALRLYERTLSESEIAQEHETPPGDTPKDGLVAAFALGKPRGRVVPDLSGNGNSVAVPERVSLADNILAWPDWHVQKVHSVADDMIVNVLGFVPLGFLFAFWREQANRSRRRRSCLFALLMGALISLGIEVAQAFIPARDSSMVDLLCNTGGVFLGVGLQMARKLGG